MNTTFMTYKEENEVLRQKIAEQAAVIENLTTALNNQNFWVEGALLCKEWRWDEDQRESAESCLAFSKEALCGEEDESPGRLDKISKIVFKTLKELK